MPISDSLTVSQRLSLNKPSSHQSQAQARAGCEVEASTHEPAVDGQAALFMYPRVERTEWEDSIELEVKGKLRQMERRTTWHPIVHTSTHSNLSFSHTRMRLLPPNPTPRLPPEILELIIQSIRPKWDIINDRVNYPCYSEFFRRQEDSIGTLATCCRVCRRWMALCQRLLFSWVILQKSAHLDSLLHLHRASHLPHISPLIRRISVAYDEPDDKFGEALPRIATMAPPNLLRIDVTPDLGGKYGYINFPFHGSLPLRLAPLHYVRILHLCWLNFANFSELRQLISCFSGLQVVFLILNPEWDWEVTGALHRRSNPLLTRISAWPYENSLWLWPSLQGSGTGKESRCNTAQISRSVPSVSAAIVTIMDTMIQRTNSLSDADCHGPDMEWRSCQGKRAHADLCQWSLHIRPIHIDDWYPQYHVPISFTVLLKFQPQTNLPHPSFDLPHLVEIGMTIHSNGDCILDDMYGISSVWKYEELMHLDNLERLQIGITTNDNNSIGEPQTKLVRYLKDHAERWEPDYASEIPDKLEHRFEPLRECDRRYELKITIDDSPLDDVLREWKEKIAAEKREEGTECVEEGTESARGSAGD